jgi:hypothetical protein
MKAKEAKKEKKQKATPEYRDARNWNMTGICKGINCKIKK